MSPTCLCGQPFTFGRSNVRRCIQCHALQVHDYDGIWIFEATEFPWDTGASTLFIPRKERKDYVRTNSQKAFEAGQYQKSCLGL